MSDEKIITLDGKKYKLVEIEEEAKKKENPFEKQANKNSEILYIGGTGEILTLITYSAYLGNKAVEERLYSVANYCTDRELIQQQAYRETLNRLLWRFSYENGWSEDLWSDLNSTKAYIFFDSIKKEFVMRCSFEGRIAGVVYFATQKLALRAIDEIVNPFLAEHPDFTDYK